MRFSIFYLLSLMPMYLAKPKFHDFTVTIIIKIDFKKIFKIKLWNRMKICMYLLQGFLSLKRAFYEHNSLILLIQNNQLQKLSFLDQSENFISVLMFTNNNYYNEIIPVCYKNRQNYAIFRTNLSLYNSSNKSILFISNFPLRKNKQILKYVDFRFQSYSAYWLRSSFKSQDGWTFCRNFKSIVE